MALKYLVVPIAAVFNAFLDLPTTSDKLLKFLTTAVVPFFASLLNLFISF